MEQASCAYAQGSRPLAQTHRQLRRQRQLRLFEVRAIPSHVQQPERSHRLSDIPQHAAEKPLVLRLACAEPCVRHEIAERRRRRKALGLPEKMRPDLID